MFERPEKLEYYGNIHDDVSKRFGKPPEPSVSPDDVSDLGTRRLIATSVAQLLSLTPESFEAKFTEICDCLVRRGVASASEADHLRRLGHAYARRDEGRALEAIEAIAGITAPSPFLRALKNETAQTQTMSNDGDKDKKLWKLIGGLIGAAVGGLIGGWSGASLGFLVGSEIALYIHETYGGGRRGSNVIAGPNGEPCTTPFFL
ncbi:hypothetical protein [Salinarimonas chemoclinalis]|uniref:hypothetical protein n=1 Tax=Salinarimonas chemoclinalis TaxID=3241599 RepID=UPI0035560B78